MRFSEAVEASPEATALITNFNVRLNRTIEIIFGNDAKLDLLNLPSRLDGVIERAGFAGPRSDAQRRAE